MGKSFETKLKDYLTLYKIPIGPEDLDPVLFYYSDDFQEYRLIPAVYQQIANDMQQFAGDQPTRIKGCYIVGNTIIPGNKNRREPLDVLVILNKNLMDMDIDGLLSEEILKLAKALSGRLAVGTTHPIRYNVAARDIDQFSYTSIYDLSKNNWYKKPTGS